MYSFNLYYMHILKIKVFQALKNHYCRIPLWNIYYYYDKVLWSGGMNCIIYIFSYCIKCAQENESIKYGQENELFCLNFLLLYKMCKYVRFNLFPITINYSLIFIPYFNEQCNSFNIHISCKNRANIYSGYPPSSNIINF